MTDGKPTRDEVLEAVRKGWDYPGDLHSREAITNEIMALLAPKPAPRRWIVENCTVEVYEGGIRAILAAGWLEVGKP